MSTYVFITEGSPSHILRITETDQPLAMAIELATLHQVNVSYGKVLGNATPIPTDQLSIETRVNNLFRH